MANIRPLNASIAFKRLQAKHKFNDYKLAEFVEHFWNKTKWPLLYFNRRYSTQQINNQKLLPYLNRALENSSRSRIELKHFQRQMHEDKKEWKKELKVLKKHWKARKDLSTKNKAKIVHKFIEEYDILRESICIDRRVPYSKVWVKNYYKIPKTYRWFSWSDEKIEKNVIQILREIRLFLFHKEQIFKEGPNALCLDRRCTVCHPAPLEPKRPKFPYYYNKKGQITLSQEHYRARAELKGIKKPGRFIKFDEDKFAAEVAGQLGLPPEEDYKPEEESLE